MNAYAEKRENALSDKKDKTGIPAAMKRSFEHSSGFSFDDVRVHYNSEKPAQLYAHAYTQGNEVYVAPGQEKHLPHELGHVVQQKRGTVRPTGELGGVPLNTDKALESGADRIAASVPVQMKTVQRAASDVSLTASSWANVGNAGVNFLNFAGNFTNIIGGFINQHKNRKMQREENNENRTLQREENEKNRTLQGEENEKNRTLQREENEKNRKEKRIEAIEKYADAACEAEEEASVAKYEFDYAADYSKRVEKGAALTKARTKVRRNYKVALSKATGAGENTVEDNGNFSNVNDENIKNALKRAYIADKNVNPSGDIEQVNPKLESEYTQTMQTMKTADSDTGSGEIMEIDID